MGTGGTGRQRRAQKEARGTVSINSRVSIRLVAGSAQSANSQEWFGSMRTYTSWSSAGAITPPARQSVGPGPRCRNLSLGALPQVAPRARASLWRLARGPPARSKARTGSLSATLRLGKRAGRRCDGPSPHDMAG